MTEATSPISHMLDRGTARTPTFATGTVQKAEVPRFKGLPFDFAPNIEFLLADEKCVCLWRFRPEWSRISRTVGMASLSPTEVARIARLPSAAQRKRLAVERANLRVILSSAGVSRISMLALDKTIDGAYELRSRIGSISISVVHAGLWIVVAMSRSRIGLSSESPICSVSTVPQNRDDERAMRMRTRRASLVKAGANGLPDIGIGELDDDANSFIFYSSARRWQVSDIPLAGSTCLSLATSCPTGTIHAFGWESYASYPITQ
jgi:hypothetical protein